MAAPTEPIPGIRLLTLIGGTVVGAQTDATLSVPSELRELVTKNNYGWVSNLSGQQEWSVDHSGLVLNSSGEEFISNQNASLELEFDDGGGTQEWHKIQHLDSIDLSLEAAIAETGGLDSELWRYIRPAQRSMSVDIEGSYLDPAADVGQEYQEIFTRKDNSERINARLTIAQKTFTADVAVGDVEISAQADSEDATISVSFASDGQVTEGGTDFDSSIEMILDAFFNETKASLAMEHHDQQGSAVTGSTTFTGDGYFTTIDISAAHGEEATLDATIDGDGPLNRGTI